MSGGLIGSGDTLPATHCAHDTDRHLQTSQFNSTLPHLFVCEGKKFSLEHIRMSGGLVGSRDLLFAIAHGAHLDSQS